MFFSIFLYQLILQDNQWNTISSFNGTLDGQNFKISGLYINSTENSKGIFNTNYGIVEKLEIIDANISAKGNSGVICSVNEGEIKEVVAYGIIKVNTTGTAASVVGGICGSNSGTISNEEAKNFVENEFEKFRIEQDKKYISDFDKIIELVKK